MAQACAQVVPEHYTLIGTSFGANVALWQTLQSPDKVEALVLIAPTAILPVAGPMADTPEETTKRLFAHPEKARGLPSVDPAIVAKEQALCSGSQAGCTMQRQNAGSVRFRVQPWCSLVQKIRWWHPRPRASTARGFLTATSP